MLSRLSLIQRMIYIVLICMMNILPVTAARNDCESSVIATERAVAGYDEMGTTAYPNAGMNLISHLNLVHEGFIMTGFIDAAGAFAYYASYATPSKIIKVDLNTNARVSSLTLSADESLIRSSIYNPMDNFAYFATENYPARLVKINLTDFTREDSIELSKDGGVRCAAIDKAANYGYFGVTTYPAQIVQVDLATMTVVSSVTLAEEQNFVLTGFVDSERRYGYFSVDSYPTQVLRFDLDNFPQPADVLTFESGEENCAVVVPDPTFTYAYYGSTWPGYVIQVDIEHFTRVKALAIDPHGTFVESAAIDPSGTFGYFTKYTYPVLITKIDLASFAIAGELECDSMIYSLGVSKIDPLGKTLYCAHNSLPAKIARINLQSFTQEESIPLIDGLPNIRTAVVDPNRNKAYLGCETNPYRLAMLDIDTFTIEKTIAPEGNTGSIGCAAINHAGTYVYFGLNDYPPKVLMVDTETFSVFGTLTLEYGEEHLRVAMIDNEDAFLYFATFTMPVRVIKVDLAEFTRVGHIDFDIGEDFLNAAVMAPDGSYAYFCPGDFHSKVISINLSTFTREDTLYLKDFESYVQTAFASTSNKAYFCTYTSPVHIAEVDLPSFTETNGISLQYAEEFCYSSILDRNRNLAYLGVGNYPPANVIKLDLNTLTQVGTLPLTDEDQEPAAGVIDNEGEHAVFAMFRDPGFLVKVGLLSQKDVVQGTKAHLETRALCSRVSFFSHTADGNVRLALYHHIDDNTRPVLVWESQVIENLIQGDWMEVPINTGTPTSITLEPGDYWLCWQTNSSEPIGSYTEGLTGNGIQWGQPFGAFDAKPDEFMLTNELWSIFLTYTDPDATPTPEPTPSSTPTPVPEWSCDLVMNEEYFCPGDGFFLDMLVYNPAEIEQNSVFVALEVMGEFWFYPSWVHYAAPDYPIDFNRIAFTPGYNYFFILDFTWPDTGTDSLSDIRFHGAIMNSVLTELICYDSTTFGFGPCK